MPIHSPVILPDLRNYPEPPGTEGWFVVASENIVVPTLRQLRRPLESLSRSEMACELVARRFDPPDRTVLAAAAPGNIIRIDVFIDPGFPESLSELLEVSATAEPEVEEELADQEGGPDPEPTPRLVIVGPLELSTPPTLIIEGVVMGDDRRCLSFEWDATAVTDGSYELSVEHLGGSPSRLTIAFGAPVEQLPEVALTSLTLAPRRRRVGRAVTQPPVNFPFPPLLAVDCVGREIAAWAASGCGESVVPGPAVDGVIRSVLILDACGEQLLEPLEFPADVKDALFWNGWLAVLTVGSVQLFDPSTGAPAPDPIFVSGLSSPLALGVTREGFLVVIQSSSESILVFRRDGSRIQAPTTLPGRGWYASLRSPAFTFDRERCVYNLEPGRAAKTPCPVTATRPLTDEESLFFRLIDDLMGLRERAAYPPSGEVIVGPTRPGDPLDARRPGTQWHRVALFGSIPPGCAVQVQTRTADDLAGVSPLFGDFSQPVSLTNESRIRLSPPGDTRIVAGTALVLAPPGRYLLVKLTLFSNGVATPLVERLEIQPERIGIGRFLPEFFQNSTPEDDFLRRWLALFEDTTFNGVRSLMQRYAELFDPRTAPTAMLPYLAGWLQIPITARLRDDTVALRRALIRARELAETRGTIAGLRLAIDLNLGFRVQIVEAFRSRSNFVLGAGVTVGSARGPVLGRDTLLSAECPPDSVAPPEPEPAETENVEAIVLFTTNGPLRIRDRVEVIATGANTPRAVNAGLEPLTVGVASVVGDIDSIGPVELSARSVLRGSLRTSRELAVGPEVTATGARIARTELSFKALRESLELRDGFSSTLDDEDDLITDNTRPTLDISPGNYRHVTIDAGGTLFFTAAGEYFFDSLTVNPGGHLQIGTDIVEPVTVLVRESVTYSGTQLGPANALFRLVVYGDLALLERDFGGILIAPLAEVQLVGGRTFRGTFIGSSITVGPDSRVIHMPWDGSLPGGIRRFPPLPTSDTSVTIPCEERLGTVAHHFTVWVPERFVCRGETLAALKTVIEAERPSHTSYRIRLTGAAGFVLGTDSVIGQELSPEFDPEKCDPRTYGLVILRGLPRPKPLGEGFVLGKGSRLVATSQCAVPAEPEIPPLIAGSETSAPGAFLALT